MITQRTRKSLLRAFRSPSTFYPGFFIVWDDKANDELARKAGVCTLSSISEIDSFHVRFDWGIQRFIIR